MLILSCITTVSFNLYFKRVPCTSKNHRQTLTADNIDPGYWYGVEEFLMQNVTTGLLNCYFAAWCFASAVYVVMRCLSVCVSVTFVDHVKMNTNISSKFFHHRVATPFWFFRAKRHSNIPTKTSPPNGGVECRCGKQKSRFWSGLTACVNAAVL